MKRIIYTALLFMLFACSQKPLPYWKTDSFGFISSLIEGDTLRIKSIGGDSVFSSFDYLRFFISGDSLYVSCEESAIYPRRILQRRDTLLLWKNKPLNISNNKAILELYRTFEREFKVWNDTTSYCSVINEFNIYFNKDTLTLIDKSCVFNFYFDLKFLIQDSTNPSDIDSLADEQANSIIYQDWIE